MAVARAHDPRPSIPVDWWERFEDPPGYRGEIIQGELTLSPSPSRVHQRVLHRLQVLLEGCCPDGYELLPDFEWRLTSGHEVAAAPRPDLMVAKAVDGPIATPPLLAVEILSPSDDQTLVSGMARFDGKALDYRRNGLEHLLVVQPDLKVIFLLATRHEDWGEVADDDQWGEVARAHGDELFETDVPFPFSVRPSELVAL